MRMFGRLMLAASAALLASCGGTETREETWEVKSNEAVCTSMIEQFCLVVRNSSQDPWRYEFGAAGFTYEWGYTYSLRVEIETVNPPPVDGGSKRISLGAVLSKTPVAPSTTFELKFNPTDRALARSSDINFMIVGSKNLVCQPGDCDTIDDLIAQGLSARMVFDHTNSPNGPLKLLSIACVAPPATFDRDCP